MAAAREREQNRIARFVLTEMERNWDIRHRRAPPHVRHTGLPRCYVRAGNEAAVEGGFVALERALRQKRPPMLPSRSRCGRTGCTR